MPVSLFTLYFLHIAVTAANSQSPWPPKPLISHDSHTPPRRNRATSALVNDRDKVAAFLADDDDDYDSLLTMAPP
jgi:hypothetical protein